MEFLCVARYFCTPLPDNAAGRADHKLFIVEGKQRKEKRTPSELLVALADTEHLPEDSGRRGEQTEVTEHKSGMQMRGN